MSEERSFLKAIRDQPEDSTARLVYADWLEEHDDARGELIRIEEEIRALPIHADRYWALKPRRRALLKSAKRPWLTQLGYGGTDYQPVFADVPGGWKERWRLVREFTERWYQIPVDDVGGPLKPVLRGTGRLLGEEDARSVDAAMNDPKVIAGLPPSLREWLFFIRDLKLGLEDFGRGSGDRHVFYDPGQRINFLQGDGGRHGCFVRDEHRHEPDPSVWWDWTTPITRRGSPRSIAPHVTTLALQYLLAQDEPQFVELSAERLMTKQVGRQLATYFPVRSSFDEVQIFERDNVISLFIPEPMFGVPGPALLVKARPPANPEEVREQLWSRIG